MTALTVAGVAATEVAYLSNASASVGLWIVDLPTGVSGDIVLERGAAATAPNALSVAVWALYGALSGTAAATGSGATSANVNVQPGDAVIVVGENTNGSLTTLTGATERFDAVTMPGASAFSGGDHAALLAESPRAISNAGTAAMVSAAWR